MKEIFAYLCNFSVVTSIAIIFAVLLRPVLKKGPSFVRCIFWTAVFLRLLIPVGFTDMPFSTPKLVETTQQTVPAQKESNTAEDVITSPVQTPANNNTVSDTLKDNAVSETQSDGGLDALEVISVIWAVGTVLMLGYMAVSNLRLHRSTKGAVVYNNNVRVLDKECSPFVAGIFKPLIYIPASVSKSDWQHIIAHETSHIKRLDHILKPLAFTVLCFYWFNPLVWVAYSLLSKDMEYACDERTVKAMESTEKREYSIALLSVSQGTGKAFAPLSFGEVNVKKRIKRVVKYKSTVWAICLTFILCLPLLAFILCSPNAEATVAQHGDVDTDNAQGLESTSTVKVSVDYVSAEEAYVTPDFTDQQGFEFIKVQVNKTVKNFNFISFSFDENANLCPGESLFGLNELTPEKPFYAKTYVSEGASNRGISFENEKGETVYCRIMYDSAGSDASGSSLYLELFQNNLATDPIVNQRITLYLPNFSDGFSSYTKLLIDESVTAENIVFHCIENGLFPKGAEMLSFEIKNRVGYLDMNSACYELSSPYQDSAGLKAIQMSFLENYKEQIDKLVITYDGETKSYDLS